MLLDISAKKKSGVWNCEKQDKAWNQSISVRIRHYTCEKLNENNEKIKTASKCKQWETGMLIKAKQWGRWRSDMNKCGDESSEFSESSENRLYESTSWFNPMSHISDGRETLLSRASSFFRKRDKKKFVYINT